MCSLLYDNELHNSKELKNGNVTFGFIKQNVPKEGTTLQTTINR